MSRAANCKMCDHVQGRHIGRSPPAVSTFTPRVCLCPAAETLQGDDLEKWNAGLSQLEKLGLDPERREKVLKQGFGWSTQKYW